MRLSLGNQVLLAVLLGLFAGIFFGPLCTILDPIGNIYIMLLQMVALPYICFTLIHGLGSITPDLAKKLVKKGWIFLAALWALIFLVIYVSAFLIPKPANAFIGSTALDKASHLTENFLTYLVPENPFYDLANNIVPAIAVFGIIVGIALMHLPKKEPLLSILERANQTIEKILKWIAILSPIGIFAHIAVASGTVYFSDLLSIEFYVVSFILISLFMVFWILPALVASLTPLHYREVLDAFKTICILPFATGVPTIALPFIILYMQRLGEKHAKGDPNFHATSQTVMPFCYSFGQLGNCLVLFYIFFLSFYYRHPFDGMDKVILSILTIPLSIGSSATSVNAVSFLIDQLNFPREAIQLFSETMAITLNFQVLLSVASITTFIILVLYSYYGLLEVKWKKLSYHFLTSFGVLIFLVILGKELIHLKDNYEDLFGNLKIAEVINRPIPSKIVDHPKDGTYRKGPIDLDSDPLSEILKTGVLKVGYDSKSIPFRYWNLNNELVGYDIAFAYELAKDLDCSLEFYPIDLTQMGDELDQGFYDIAMSAIIMDEDRILKMDFTHPYLEQDIVLVVPEKKKSNFKNLLEAKSHPGIRFGAVGGFVPTIQKHFPLGIHVPGYQPLNEFQEQKIDAWITAHSLGFAWCLYHPKYLVVDYDGEIGRVYFSYPVKSRSVDWISFLNSWLALKNQSGFSKRMYNYWIAGESPKKRPPRWSILKDVLGWTQ